MTNLTSTNVNTGILKKLLANTFTLYLKTLNYHWHIKGRDFYEIHLLLEKQYNDLATSIDEIAETIVAYGEKAPASMKEYLDLTDLKEGEINKSEKDIISELEEDNEKISQMISQAVSQTDYITSDILSQRGRVHKKNSWMLKSFITD